MALRYYTSATASHSRLRRLAWMLGSDPAKDMKVGAKAFQNEEYYIPLRQEEAVIEKETRVREEFHARKAAKTEHKTISDDVRKEDIEVINQQDVRPQEPRSDSRARR